ncbi:hypothetical protein KY284_030487 [Solanum tuberosum]|nr:hypothetical protein KY284_030487 [Solanum tuberosum]
MAGAGAGAGGTASMPSMPPPRPKSPPQYPDLYGKRREFAKVQMLEREIGFLEEELKSIEGLHPASRSCKEVTEFVSEHSDPLIPTIKKTRRSCCFWKWLWRITIKRSHLYIVVKLACCQQLNKFAALLIESYKTQFSVQELAPKCLTAAVTAIYVTAAHISVAQYLSVDVSPVHGLNAAASLSANGVVVA